MAAFTFAQIGPPRIAHLPQPAAQRQMTGWFFARREVVMIPAFRRDEQASRLPIDAHEFSTRLPHERISFAGDDDDLRSGSMAMRLFVGPRFDSHDVTDHRITGKMNAQATKADASLRMGVELDRREIRNKIHNPIFELSRPKLAAEKIFLAGEAIAEFYGSIEDEIRRVIDIHY